MNDFADSYRHKGMRKKLANSIREKGITDERIIEAIEKIPRHWFLNSSFLEYAYQDKPFPIGSGQTISQPYTVAFQTDLLEIKAGDKVLEIGTGSGYQACVFIEMGAKVYTIERQKKLFEQTKTFLPKIGYFPRMSHGDGYKGLPKNAPFDKILVTAAAKYIPDDLLKQLKVGGRLVIPVGGDTVQTMVSIDKESEKDFVKKEHGLFRFVPMLDDTAND